MKKKKQTAWNKGITGKKSHSWGRPVSKKTRKKISKSNKGKVRTRETRQKISLSRSGISWEKIMGQKKANILSKQFSKKMIGNKYRLGKSPWNKGKQLSCEYKLKLIKSAKRRIKKRIALPPSRKGTHISEEHRKAISGSNNKGWLGGKSFEPYTPEFNRRFKESIRLRDSLMCQKCGMFAEDHQKIFHYKLAVHHVNYDKKLCVPENCVTLCKRCHAETNHNREAWRLFFQKIMSKKYGYRYDDKGRIIVELTNNHT